MRTFICNFCGCEFLSKKACRSRTPKYCGAQCYIKSLIKVKLPKKERVSRKGITLNSEWRKALSEGRKASEKCKGENLYNWKGGKETLSERMKLHAHNRKSAQKIGLDKNFLDQLLIAQENKCFYCDQDLTNYKAIEHLTPLSKGGDNQKYNLVYACGSCNSRKRDKTLEEFAVQNNRFDWLDKFDIIFPKALYGV